MDLQPMNKEIRDIKQYLVLKTIQKKKKINVRKKKKGNTNPKKLTGQNLAGGMKGTAHPIRKTAITIIFATNRILLVINRKIFTQQFLANAKLRNHSTSPSLLARSRISFSSEVSDL